MSDANSRQEFEEALNALVNYVEQATNSYPLEPAREREYSGYADEEKAKLMRLYDARPSAPNDETGWLIECKHIGNAAWWDGKRGPRDLIDCRYFTTDHLKAVRFARKEDAERIIKGCGGSCMQATEHLWVGKEMTPDDSVKELRLSLREAHYALDRANKRLQEPEANDEAREALKELVACHDGMFEYLEHLRIHGSPQSKPSIQVLNDKHNAVLANARRVLGHGEKG